MRRHYPNQLTYESISWDFQDIVNREGFLASSSIRAVSMTALPRRHTTNLTASLATLNTNPNRSCDLRAAGQLSLNG